MGQTLAEKILSSHSSRQVKAGEFAIVNLDVVLMQDGTGPLTVRQLQKLGKPPAYPERTVVFLDHAGPNPRPELAKDHEFLRNFCKETNCRLVDVGVGICHQIMAEEYGAPGMVIIGADSHTCTAGGLGAFATGMGSSDVAVGAALGQTWMKVPQTFKIQVSGKLPKGVYSKDVILHLIGMLGADGATYAALEFTGDTISNMPVSERLVLSNMAVEAGAKAGLIAADDKTREYLENTGRGKQFKPLSADKDAFYERVIEIDAAKLVPTFSCPHTVDNVKTIDTIGNVPVQMVFIGSCTNGRIEDLRIVAQIWKGRKRNPNTRILVTPASEKVYKQAEAEGLVKTFKEFGAQFTIPYCGLCIGLIPDVLKDGENCLGTSNRNFKGRMGNPKAFTYLGSPASAAAAAVEGKIADPRKYF